MVIIPVRNTYLNFMFGYALIPIPIHRLAYQCSHRHGDKTEVMERVVFGICLGSSDYERCCTSREFLAHNREETVFASARPHRVVLLYQSVSPDQSRGGQTEGSEAHRERPTLRWTLSKLTGETYPEMRQVGDNPALLSIPI